MYLSSARSLTVPAAATMLTSLPLLHVIGAVAEADNVSPFSTSVTPVTFFLTTIVPFAQLPDTTYVPLSFIVSEVPSILYPEYAPSVTAIPESVKTNAVASVIL